MVKIRTFNWNSGNGFYELEQTYSSYTRQNYSTCKVKFTAFTAIEYDNPVTVKAGKVETK